MPASRLVMDLKEQIVYILRAVDLGPIELKTRYQSGFKEKTLSSAQNRKII